MNIRRFFLMLMCIVFELASFNAQAISQQVGDSADISFTGQLQGMTPCLISNDNIIEIPFGNISINKIESGIYSKEIEYELDCGGAGAANTIIMTLKSDSVTSDESAVESGLKGLWVKFYKDGRPLALNREFKVDDVLTPPKLMVSLIVNPEEVLGEGSFSISTTLIAEYS